MSHASLHLIEQLHDLAKLGRAADAGFIRQVAEDAAIALTAATSMTNPTQAKVPAGWTRSIAFDDAADECARVAREATFADTVTADERKGFAAACGMLRGLLRLMASRAAPNETSTPPAPASVADEASGLLDQLARDVAAFAALPKPEQAMLQRELATIGCNPGLAFAAGERMPDDVRRLVIAARVVAYGDPEPDDFAKMERAVEAFADRVGWDDEPETTEGTSA